MRTSNETESKQTAVKVSIKSSVGLTRNTTRKNKSDYHTFAEFSI